MAVLTAGGPAIAHVRRLLGLVLAGCAIAPVHAGPLLEETLARHRALLVLEPTAVPALTPIALSGDGGSSFTAAVGGLGDDVRSFVLAPLRGEGGLRVRADATLADGRVEARFGAAWWANDAYPLSFDGSSLSTGLGAGRIYASVERRHWGPSWISSLILDGSARPVPAVGWRKESETAFRTPLLSWLGPWQLDAFAGQTVERRGPQHPHLLGLRVEVMPLRGLELAASRTIQWGGSGRPETFRSLVRGLVGQDNTDATMPQADEPGNSLAGFDARYTYVFGAARTASIYGQAIGEDEAGHWPSHYLGLIGVDTAFAVGAATVRVFAERADTSMSGTFGNAALGGAYRHHIYLDGYTHQGEPLGHPAGGDVRLSSLGVFVDAGTWSGTLMVHRGDAYATAQLYPGGGRLAGVNGEATWQVDASSRLGVAVAYWRDPLGERTRAQLWWRVAFR